MANRYKHQIVTAASFGLTSGVISALGMMVGLQSATGSKLVVVTGIIIMAIADGLADAAGMHLSEEAEAEKGRNKHTRKEVWLVTLLTMASVIGVVLTFAVPIILLPLGTAVLAAVLWGMLLLILLNYYVAKSNGENPVKMIAEHLLLAIALIIISNWVGSLIALAFR